MTARDPGHAGGAQVYRPPLPPCKCGHSDGVHNLTPAGLRSGCSAWHARRGGRAEYCPCRGYETSEP